MRNPTGSSTDGTLYCPASNFNIEPAVYEFSTGRELNIIQKTHGIKYGDDSVGHTSISTKGEIRLRNAPEDSGPRIMPYMVVEMGSTEDDLPVNMRWSEDSQTLEVSTPRYLKGYYQSTGCLYLIITAYLPRVSEFTNIRFEAKTLNLALADINANVTGRSKFITDSGEVWLATWQNSSDALRNSTGSSHTAISSKPLSAPQAQTFDLQFSSRRITVETISGAITGSYPLLDDLLLSSQSGSIDVNVVPKPAEKSAPAPADLEVQTASGSIHVGLPVGFVAEYTPVSRDYITRVHSLSGGISGTYYLGSESSFKTTSGSIEITTLPVLPKEIEPRMSKAPPNLFETHTISGTTAITVLDPIFFANIALEHPPSTKNPCKSVDDEDPYLLLPPDSISMSKVEETPDAKTVKLRSLRSSHSSNNGKVTARYPNAWQGTVHAKTVSGAVTVNGDGFRTVKSRTGPGYSEVVKRRGVDKEAEGSFVDLGNISGAVDFEISRV